MAALKKSETGLMEVSEENEKIRRSPSNPLPENTEEAKKALEARTAYAKGRKFVYILLVAKLLYNSLSKFVCMANRIGFFRLLILI